MISKEFYNALNLLAVEREIPVERVLEIFKKGIESAYKKEYNRAENVVVDFQPEKNKILVFSRKEVVNEFPEKGTATEFILLENAKKIRKSAKIGEALNIELSTKEFGRLAASQTKQILNQGLKDYEKELIYDYFKKKENEIVIATVVAINENFISLSLAKNTVTNLPVNETNENDNFKIGDKIRVYVTKVELISEKKKTKVFVSRKDKNYVRRIFEKVVPEIVDGTIEIMGLARDAGERTKVAIATFDQYVDPISACIGINKVRINEIIDNLNGEKIDIFVWDNDPKVLIANSLSPAKVVGISINQRDKEALAIVDESQLSLAIGKRGQNVRLAVKATGWKIDIKPLTEAIEKKIPFEKITTEKYNEN